MREALHARVTNVVFWEWGGGAVGRRRLLHESFTLEGGTLGTLPESVTSRKQAQWRKPCARKWAPALPSALAEIFTRRRALQRDAYGKYSYIHWKHGVGLTLVPAKLMSRSRGVCAKADAAALAPSTPIPVAEPRVVVLATFMQP